MAKAPTYQRSQLPPGSSMQPKPPYSLADRSGQIGFGQTIANTAGGIWERLIESDAANEQAEFLGKVDTQIAGFEDYVKKNPGLPFEQYQIQRNKMLDEIRKAGENARTGIAKNWIRNWYTRNTRPAVVDGRELPGGLLQEKFDTARNAIIAEDQQKRFDIQIDTAIKTGDINKLANLYSEQAGRLISAETATELFKADRVEAIYYKWFNIARDDPESVLKAIKEGTIPQELRDNPGYEQALESNAKGALYTKQQDSEKIYDQDRQKILDRFVQGNFDAIDEFINKETSLEPKEKEQWMTKARTWLDNADKDVDQVERGQARNEIYDAITKGNKKKAIDLWSDKAWMFTAAKNDQINDDIRNIGKADHFSSDPIYKIYNDAIYNLMIAGAEEPEKDPELLRQYADLKESFTNWWRNNPDATVQQKADFYKQITKPYREEKVKGWLAETIDKWARMGPALKQEVDDLGRLMYNPIGAVTRAAWRASYDKSLSNKEEQTNKNQDINETLLNIEPQDYAGFRFEIQRIAANDKELAQKYYDTWKHKWQKP